MPKVKHIREKREFIRLNSAFPVEFQFFKNDTETIGGWHQGFTCNVSYGGICLEFLNLEEIAEILNQGVTLLKLKIHIPLFEAPVLTMARVVRFNKEEGKKIGSQDMLGLKYENIAPRDNRRIMRFAYGKIILPNLALAAIIILFFAFAISSYNNIRTTYLNKKLIGEIAEVMRNYNISKEELEDIKKEKAILEAKLLESDSKIRSEEEKLEKIQNIGKEESGNYVPEDRVREIEKLRAMISLLEQDRINLLKEIDSVGRKEEIAMMKLAHDKKKKNILESENFKMMYQWVKIHQNPRTGLISSFEGDWQLNDQAFTYDQALAVIAFSYFKDYELAQKILDFYLTKAKRKEAFYNGYYSSTGEVGEFVIHSGPNLWLGIAVLQYTSLSGNDKYLPIAKDIARWIIKLKDEDKTKGIRGGPLVEWYSTEHNLDGFAFFNMFYQLTKEPLYKRTCEEIVGWLKTHAYDRPDIPVRRGKGDSTIATDTYAWSIASLGVDRLIGLEMNPEDILKFAEDNCSATVEYLSSNGEAAISVKGFDFAKQRHLPRGGVISCEWTAQMALSYKILSKYFASKADKLKEKLYNDRAEEYLEELTKMIISSPSPTGQGQGCLPYASIDFVDTGHGWMTPKGKNTGSVSATIYTIFAYYGFNPLELNS